MRSFTIALLALSTLSVFATAHAAEPAADAPIARACGISHTGNAWASNRYNRMPAGTLQVAGFYDGNGNGVKLAIQLVAPNGAKGFIHVGANRPGGPIDNFGTGIESRQYRIGGCKLTGLFEVQGVAPNGMVDGLAFGVHARYADNTFRVLRSIGRPSNRADFVGAWPLGMDTNLFNQRASEITDGIARSQAWAALYGAQLMPNGKVQLQVK